MPFAERTTMKLQIGAAPAAARVNILPTTTATRRPVERHPEPEEESLNQFHTHSLYLEFPRRRERLDGNLSLLTTGVRSVSFTCLMAPRIFRVAFRYRPAESLSFQRYGTPYLPTIFPFCVTTYIGFGSRRLIGLLRLYADVRRHNTSCHPPVP